MHPVFAPIHFVRRQLWHMDPKVVCVYQIEDLFSYHKDRQDEKHIENLHIKVKYNHGKNISDAVVVRVF